MIGWGLATTDFELTVEDPVPGTVSFAPNNPTTVEEGDSITLRVDVSGSDRSAAVSLDWDVANGTGDIANSSGTATIAANDDFVQFDIPTTEDAVAEIDKSFTVTLTVPSGFTRSTTRGTHRFTVIDDDGTSGTVGFASAESNVVEGTGVTMHAVPVTVSAAPASSFSLSVDVIGEETSAMQSTDFTVPATLQVSNAGDTNLVVEILDDAAPEIGETVFLRIPDGNNGIPADFSLDRSKATHIVHILPNDNTITFSEPSPSVLILDEESKSAVITATINRPMPAGRNPLVTVTQTGGDLRRGSEYSLSVSEGTISATVDDNNWRMPTEEGKVTLTVTALPGVDSNKTLTLDFAGVVLPTGWSIAGDTSREITVNASNIVRIRGPEAPNNRVAEGGSISLRAGVTNPSNLPDAGIEVTVSSNGGFASLPITHTFTRASPALDIPLSVPEDRIPEMEKQATVTMAVTGALPGGWQLGESTYIFTVIDNDNRVGFASGLPATASESPNVVALPVEFGSFSGTGEVVFDVALTGVDYDGDSIDLENSKDATLGAIPGGTAESAITVSTTGTLSFTGDGTLQTKDIMLTIRDDGIGENAETFTVTLTPPQTLPSGIVTGNLVHSITVAAHGNTVGFADSPRDFRVTEAGAFEDVPLALTGPAPEDIVLTLSEVAGSPAPDAGDYEITAVFPARWNDAARTLTIPRGANTASLRIRANRDGDTDSEEFTLALGASSLPDGWTLSDSVTSRKITISDTGVPRSDGIGFVIPSARVEEGREHTVQLTIVGDVPSDGIDLKIGLEGTLDDETDVLYKGEPLLRHGATDPSVTLPITPADASVIDFTINIPQDRRAELDAEVHFILDVLDPQTENGLPNGWAVGEHARHTVTIPANDNLFSLQEGPSNTTRLEKGGELDVTVTIEHASPVPSSVELVFSGSDAAEGVSVREAVAAGDTSGASLLRPGTNIIDIPGSTEEVTVTLASAAGDVPENDESVQVLLVFAGSRPHGWGINEEKRSLDLTIPRHTVAFKSPVVSSLIEGTSGPLVVEVSPPYTEEIKVSLAIPEAHRQDISISGTGYEEKVETGGSTGGILTIPAGGDGMVSLTVTANDDDGAELEERIGVTLSPDPDNALSGSVGIGAPSTHTVIIPVNDNTISITADETTVEEEGTATLTVTANSAPALPEGGITVNLSVAGTDARLSEERLTLTPDSPSDTVTFTATADDILESDETVSVIMTAADALPHGWSLASTFDVTILANDTVASITMPDQASETDGMVDLGITVVAPPTPASDEVSFTLSFDGTEVSFDEDSQDNSVDITIPVPETASGDNTVVSTTVPVHINPDADSDDEAVVFTLTPRESGFPASWGSVPDPTQETLNITDSNVRIGFATSGVAVSEGGRRRGPRRFPSVPTVVLIEASGELTETVTLTLAVAQPNDSDSNDDVNFYIDNPAYDRDAPVDPVNPISSTLAVTEIDVILTPENPSQSVEYRVINDTTPEAAEVATFSLAFKESPSANILVGDGDGDISTDDNTRPFESFALTIQENDGGEGETISFSTLAASEINEGEEGVVAVLLSTDAPLLPVPGGLVVNVKISGTDAADDEAYEVVVDSGVSAPATGGTTYNKETGVLTIRKLHSSGVLRFTALADTDQVDEEITLTLAADPNTPLPSGWKITGTKTHTLRFKEVGSLIGFASETVLSAEEGESVTLRVETQDAPSSGTSLTVDWAVTTNAADVVDPDSGSVTIQDGQTTSEQFTLSIFDDELVEDVEEIVVTLSENDSSLLPDGYKISSVDGRHTISVSASDNLVFFDSNANEKTVNEDVGSTTFDISLTNPAPVGNLPLLLTATSGNDDGVVSFANGSAESSINIDVEPGDGRSHPVTVYVLPDDSQYEEEMIVFTLTPRGSNFPSGWGAVDGTRDTYTLIVTDDDVQTIGFAQTGSAAFEGDTHEIEFEVAGYTVTSGGYMLDNLGVTGNLADVLYNSSPLTDNLSVTVLPGAAQENPRFTVNIVGDAASEDAETVTFSLPDPLEDGFTAGENTTHTLTIEPSDNTVSFNSSAGHDTDTVAENVGMVDLTITLSPYGAPSTGLPLVLEITSGNTGSDANLVTFNSDGTAQRMREFIVPSGMTTHPVTVYVNDDSVRADHGDVIFTLTQDSNSFPSGWGEVDASASTYTLTVTDDEVQTIGFAQTGSSAFEGDNHEIEFEVAGYTVPDAGFPLNGLGVTGNLADVSYNGSPLANNLSVSVLPGASTQDNPRFTVRIDDDTTPEDAETVTFTLPDPLGGGFTAGENTTHTLTIEPSNNTAFFDPAAVTVPEDVGGISLTVTLSPHGAPSSGLPLVLEITSGNTGSDANLVTFNRDGTAQRMREFIVPAGMTTHSVPVYVNNNNAGEDHDDVVFTLKPGGEFPSGWGAVDGTRETYTLSVNDDDRAFAFTFTDPVADSINEGASTTLSLNFGNVLNAPAVLRVNASGTGINADDISFTPSAGATFDKDSDNSGGGSLTIENGTRSPVVLTVTAEDDTLTESDEILTLALDGEHSATSIPRGWEIGASDISKEITIPSNDNTATFATGNPVSVLESVGMTTLNIALTNPAPSSDGLNLSIEAKGNTAAVSFSQTDETVKNRNFNIPAGMGVPSHPITVYVKDGTDQEDDHVTFELTAASPFPSAWGSVPSGETHALTIAEPSTSVSGTVGFTSFASMVDEPAGEGTASHSVIIETAGTLPDTGTFDLTINTNTVSGKDNDINTADADDYSVVPPLTTKVSISSIGMTSLDFSILGDEIPEADEDIELTLSAAGLPQGWNLGTIKKHTVTILANDSSVGFSAPVPGTGTLAESRTSYNIPVTLNAPAPRDMEFLVRVTGTDHSGAPIGSPASDIRVGNRVRYGLDGRDTDPAKDGHQETVNVPVEVIEDLKAENKETFTIELLPISAGIPADFTRDLMRTFDVPPHDNTVTFKGTQPVSVTEEGGAVTVELELTNPVTAGYTVSITQSGGDDSNDLTINPENITISEGNSTASFTLTANDDPDKISEAITLTLDSSQTLDGWSVPANTTRTVNINDNDRDPAPTATIGFGAGTSSAPEDDATDTSYEVALAITGTAGTFMPQATLPVTLTVELGQDVRRGSGGDVTFVEMLQINEMQFQNGSVTYPIVVLADDEREEDETVTIRLTQQALPEGWTLGTIAEHVVTIPENDQPAGPTIGFAEEGAVVAETKSYPLGVQHNVPLALTMMPTTSFSVHFIHVSANGAVPGGTNDGDYSVPPVHKIESGGATSDYNVTIYGDREKELLESFTVIFADEQPDLPDGWSVDPDNKRYRVSIRPHGNTIEFASADDLTITELDGDSHSVDIEISVDHPLPPGTNATIAISHGSGSTASEADYRISGTGYNSGILTIPEMEETVTLTIEAVDDDEADRGERFTIELTDLVLPGLAEGGWSIGDKKSLQFEIRNDDPVVTGSVGFAQTDEAGGINLASVKEGQTGKFTVMASSQPETNIPVTWRVTAGAEDVEPDEGTVTILAREQNATFDITAISDNATVPPEVDEEITVTLSGDLIRGFSLGDSTHTFTIPANGRNIIGFAEPATAVVHEDGEAILRLELKNATGLSLAGADIPVDGIPLTFTYTEADGESGADDGDPDTEVSSPGSLSVTRTSSITNGIFMVSPVVTVKNDNAEEEAEGQETVTVTLGMGNDFPVEWLIGNDTYTIIIPANDAPPAANNIGFAETELGLYHDGGPQNVQVRESQNTVFPQGVSLVATIEDTDVVSFGAPNTQPTMNLTPSMGDTEASFQISSSNPGGTTTIALSVAPGQSLPSGWGLDESKNVLTVHTYQRLAGFAQPESETLLSAGTVRVRLDFGAPAPSHFTAEVTTDTSKVTLPTQPMRIVPGVRFHEFDVTIVNAARSSRDSVMVSLRLEDVVDDSGSGSTWEFGPRDHDLKLLPQNLVSFDSGTQSGEVREDAGIFPVMLNLTADTPTDFSVDFALKDAAMYGDDVSVVSTNTSPTFRAGEDKAIFNLAITDDEVKESLEEVEFTLSEGTDFPATGWEIDTTTYTLTIIDDDGDASGEISFDDSNSERLVEGAGLTPLKLSLDLAGGGTAIAPAGGIGLSLSSSDPGRVAIPAEWASFTIPGGTSGEITFMVNVLGDDGDTEKNNVTLTLKQGTDEAGAGFPSGWGFTGNVTELPLTLDVIEAPRIGFARLQPTDRHFNNFDEVNFTLKVAESSRVIELPIETSTPAPKGGLPLTVSITRNDGNIFSFADRSDGGSSHSFRIEENQTRHNLRINMRSEESGNTNDETGVFRLSLDQSNFPADIPNAVVTRNEITVESIDHQRNEGGTISIDGPALAIEFTEPHDSELESPEIVLYDGFPTFVYYLDIVFTALPRPAVEVDGVPGFYLGARRFGVSGGGDVMVHEGTTPLRSGDTVPDIAIPREFFIPIHEIEIRRNDYLWRLPVHVFRDLPGDAQTESERENFGIELTNPRGFPAGITGFARKRQNLRIIDRGGGLVRFVGNDTSADGEAFNRSFVREGETLQVRVISTRTIQRPTPFSWRIFKIVGEFTVGATEDFASGDYLDTIEIPAGMNSVDFEVRTVDDGKAEGDETYFIELREPFDGSGFPSEFGRQIDPDPEKNRYTFTIRDNDSAPLFDFAGARAEAAEGDVITIPFSLVQSDPRNNRIPPLVPDEGICLILEVSGTAIDEDVFHIDTSRSGTTTAPIPNCDSTRGMVDAAIGTDTIAEYLPGGAMPEMRLRINDDDVLETGEEITFSIPRRDRGLPGTWLVGERTSYTVAIEASDNLIGFAAPTSSLTENTTDRSARPSQEVPINIIGAVPEEEIEGDEKVIRLQASIATMNDTNMEDDIALSIAYHASSGIELDSTGVLTIPANISEVPLVVRAVDDGINDDQEVEQVTITLTEIAESPLPAGWSIDTSSGNNVHTVSVIDDDDAAFVQLGEQYKDGYTVSEASRSWFDAPMFIEATQAAPPPPQGSPDGTSFAMRVELDENSPYYDYIGVSHADVTVDPSRTFSDQGLSRATVRFRYNETSRSVFFYTRDNPFEEGSVSINATLTPSGDLPGGWELGERTTLTINITDDDGTVFFDPGQPKIFNEGHGVVTLYLEASRTGLTHYRADVTLRDGEGNVLPRNGEFLSLPKLTNGTEYVGTMQADFNDSTRAGAVAQSPGSITPVATFTIHEDDNFTDEVVTYELSTPVLEPRGWGRVADPLVWTFTIEDNDTGGWIEFAEAESSISEGGAGNSTDIDVYLRQALPEPTKVDLTFSGVAQADYTITSTGNAYDSDTGILTFPANTEKVTLTVTNAADAFSGHRELVLELAERSGEDGLPENWNVRPGGNRHTVTIVDDDLRISFITSGVSPTPSEVAEPDSGSTTDTVKVGIAQAPTADITLRVSAEASAGEEGRATPDSDFTFADAYITFTPTGPREQTLNISIAADDEAEPVETIVLTLADDRAVSRKAENSGFVFGDNHVITIPANDNTVGFASDAVATLRESNETRGVDVEIDVDTPALVPITLDIETGGSAKEGEDYTISPKSLTIFAGRSGGTVTLTSTDDKKHEGDEPIELTIKVRGNLPEGWAPGDLEHTVTLQDDDFFVSFVRPSDTIDEPGSDTDYTIDIKIDRAPVVDVTIEIVEVSRLEPNSADTSGDNVDVTFSPSSVTFVAGDSSNLTKTVTLNVKHDTLAEQDEHIELRLEDRDNTLTAGGNAFSWGEQRNYRLDINANDNTVSIDSGNSPGTLEEDGTVNVVVKVDKPSPDPITLNVSATSSSTPPAVSGEDYNALPGTLEIPAKSDTGTLTITGIDDEIEQGSLEIDLEFSGTLPTGWAFDPLGTSLTHRVTILENDLPFAGWTTDAATYHAGDNGNVYTATATLSRTPNRQVELGISFGGTARRGTDFFVPGIANSCSVIVWPENASDADLQQSCELIINASAVGKTIIMTLIDSAGHLQADGFSVTPVPADHTITVREPVLSP